MLGKVRGPVRSPSYSFLDLPCWLKWNLVVTGASDGIGAQFAIQLAEAGFSVVLVGRNEDKLKVIEQKIKGDRRMIFQRSFIASE